LVKLEEEGLKVSCLKNKLIQNKGVQKDFLFEHNIPTALMAI
jgi:hypothetical protein